MKRVFQTMALVLSIALVGTAFADETGSRGPSHGGGHGGGNHGHAVPHSQKAHGATHQANKGKTVNKQKQIAKNNQNKGKTVNQGKKVVQNNQKKNKPNSKFRLPKNARRLARNFNKWSRWCWSARYGCRLYCNSDDGRWYYYCYAEECYLPYGYAVYFPPTQEDPPADVEDETPPSIDDSSIPDSYAPIQDSDADRQPTIEELKTSKAIKKSPA